MLLGHGKAEIVEESERLLRSFRNTFKIPSVIRMVYYMGRPRPIPRLTQREIFARDGFCCQYYGKKMQDLTRGSRPASASRRRTHLGERGRRLPDLQSPRSRAYPAGGTHAATKSTFSSPLDLRHHLPPLLVKPTWLGTFLPRRRSTRFDSCAPLTTVNDRMSPAKLDRS